MWKEGSKIIFVVKVVERNEIAISNAAVEIVDSASSSVPAKSSTPAPAPASKEASSVAVPGFAASKIFEQAAVGMSASSSAERKAQVAKVKAVFQFDVTGDGGKSQSWFIDLKVSFMFLYCISFFENVNTRCFSHRFE